MLHKRVRSGKARLRHFRSLQLAANGFGDTEEGQNGYDGHRGVVGDADERQQVRDEVDGQKSVQHASAEDHLGGHGRVFVECGLPGDADFLS